MLYWFDYKCKLKTWYPYIIQGQNISIKNLIKITKSNSQLFFSHYEYFFVDNFTPWAILITIHFNSCNNKNKTQTPH